MQRESIVVFTLFFGALLFFFSPQDGQAQVGRDLTVNISQAGVASAIPTKTNVAFVVTVANIRAGAANNVLTTVTFPAGFTLLSATPEPASGLVCNISGRIASCTAATFGGNTQKTFRVSVTAPATISGTTQPFTITGVVDPNNTVSESDNANNSDNFTINVVTRADLDVNLTSAAGVFTTQVAPDLVYVVTAKNTGDAAAPNLLVKSTLPRDVAFVRVEENQLGTCLQNSADSSGALQVNCTLSSLAAGASRHVRILGRIVGSIPDGTKVTFATNADPNNTIPERNNNDNTAFMLTTVRAPSEVQLTGAVTTARQGGTSFSGSLACVARSANFINVSLTVKNNGPFASRPTSVVIDWPTGISSGVAAQCFDSCNVPALNPGQSFSILSIGHADVTIQGNASATATVDSGNQLFDSIRANNRVTLQVCGSTP